jgi:hypothetical protein
MNNTPATINAVRHDPTPQTQIFFLRVQPLVGFRNREEGAFKAALGEFVVDIDFSAQRRSQSGKERSLSNTMRSRQSAAASGLRNHCPCLLKAFSSCSELPTPDSREHAVGAIPPCGTAIRPVI